MQESPLKSRKRVREACDPCRRKKGRCGGEKPVCSLCARLGQNCTYAGNAVSESSLLEGISDSILNETYNVRGSSEDETNSQFWEPRMQSLDSKLTEVLDRVRTLSTFQTQQNASQTPSLNQISPVPNSNLSVEVARKAARLYLQFCHCQPLSLFSPENFERTIFTRDAEVQLCVAGIALRFDAEGRSSHGLNETYANYTQAARAIIMSRLAEGRIELSTLQSLCLLIMIDFNDGKPQQAGVNLAIAIDLARSARLDLLAHQTLRSPKADEYVRCLWSVIMLQYLSGGVGVMTTVIDPSRLQYPPSDGTNTHASTYRQNNNNSHDARDEMGVVAYAAQMTAVWYDVRQYVHHRGKLDKHPPWSGQSSYSEIMFRQMEVESQMPHRHRYKPSGFSEHSISILSTNRHYWAPWLYLQIIYHANVCALNHPILLSIHLRRFRVNQIPELFLQQIADLIGGHTDWIIHLLEIATEKRFEFSDPFLGQCIAIIATIFLQQSYTEDQDIRADKQSKYRACLKIVRELGRSWRHVEQLAADLEEFEATVSKAFELSSIEISPDLSRYVDLTTFWRIMDNNLMSTTSTQLSSMFGSSLRQLPKTQDEAEILRTHLLPEPTRVNSLPHASNSTISTPAARQDQGQVTETGTAINNSSFFESFADTPFPAQNFFALGQDFVGNADDWMNWTGL